MLYPLSYEGRDGSNLAAVPDGHTGRRTLASMSLRGVVRALFRRNRSRPAHAGDELADDLRDAMGPQVGGDLGGRLTGSAVDRYFEGRERS